MDESTITERILSKFEDSWIDIDERLKIVSGKKVLASLNTYLQENYSITITPNKIIILAGINEFLMRLKN